jgi:hypothetical protein
MFTQTLFRGSPFLRWALTPFLLLFAVVMPLLLDNWTPGALAVMIGMELMCLSLLAGFWLPARIGQWAFRILAALVFLAYAAYLIHAFFFTHTPFKLAERRSEASPRNALLGFVLIGLPCLWFALKGRFTILPEPSPEQLIAERQACEDQILQPDWDFYHRHLQRPPPAALRELYADRALVTACGLKYIRGRIHDGISTFHPIREENLIDPLDQTGCDILAFATSHCGDAIYLRPGVSEPDIVYIAYHDGGDIEIFAESVAALVQRLRELNRDSLPKSGERFSHSIGDDYSRKLSDAKKYYPFDRWASSGLDQYSGQTSASFAAIFDHLIEKLATLGEHAPESQKIAAFKEAVQALNHLNEQGEGLIETEEREDLCELCDLIATAARIDPTKYGAGEGVASEWRHW